jgi:hypothetical protein
MESLRVLDRKGIDLRPVLLFEAHTSKSGGRVETLGMIAVPKLKSALQNADGVVVTPVDPTPQVKYFKRNDTGLLAVVECLAIADNGTQVLVEIIVAGRDAEKCVTLEDISAVPGG